MISKEEGWYPLQESNPEGIRDLGTLKKQFLQNGYWQRFQRKTLISKQKKHFYIFRLLPSDLHKMHKTTTILLQ